MKKIIGMGNALTDILTRLKNDDLLGKLYLSKGGMQLISENNLQRINRLLSDRKTSFSTGGSAGNTIKALANLGHAVGFIGKVGDDLYGRYYQAAFSKLGIDTKLSLGERPSGVATTFVTPDGERTFCTFLGAAATLTSEDITLDLFEGYSCLYMEGYLVQDHDMIHKAIRTARQSGLEIVFNMPSYNIVRKEREFLNDLISHEVDILFVNEEETKAFTGKENEEALQEMLGLCPTVIVKQGAHGAFIKSGGRKIRIQAIPVKKVVDTTGAGDYFAAGFLYGYIQGAPLEICGTIGALLGSEVVQIMGTTLPEERWKKRNKEIKQIIGSL